MTGLPATTVPMPTGVGVRPGNDDEVPCASGDLPVASRTQVGLHCGVGLHRTDLNVLFRAHHHWGLSAHQGPDHECCNHDERTSHHEVIGC